MLKQQKATADEQGALQFLYAYMPVADVTDYPTSFFLENVRTSFDATGIHEYHFSARVNVPSKMKQLNTNVYMGAEGADESNSPVTSAERVKQTIANLLG